MGGPSDVHRDLQLAGERAESVDMVLMFVGDEDSGERGGVFAGKLHALEGLAAGESGVNEDAGTGRGGREHAGVAFGTAREHRDPQHCASA